MVAGISHTTPRAEIAESSRSRALFHEHVDSYGQFFTDIDVFLKEHCLINKPSRIFNIYETLDDPTKENIKRVF